VRSVIFGLFLGLMTVFNASADVMYSYYEPDPPPEFGLTPNISFEFTEPSLLTTLTVVPGSSIKSVPMFDGGRSVSILSVTIDPGMNNGSYWIAPGVPYLGIVMGIDGQYAMSEGMCFVPDHYGCTASPNADVMDHFGTYTIVDSSLTISSTLVPPPSQWFYLPMQTFNSWSFPIVGKYRFPVPLAQPYLEAGPTFRTASSVIGHYLSRAGVTAGIGIETGVWKLHFSPEVRFIHWNADAPDAGLFYASRRNQAQFLIGLAY
jgi:hypothetical protein